MVHSSFHATEDRSGWSGVHWSATIGLSSWGDLILTLRLAGDTARISCVRPLMCNRRSHRSNWVEMGCSEFVNDDAFISWSRSRIVSAVAKNSVASD